MTPTFGKPRSVAVQRGPPPVCGWMWLPGYTCEGADTVPSPCPPGMLCKKDSGKAVLCPAGNYCPGASQHALECPEGYQCPEGSTQPVPCPAGAFCPSGVINPILCPSGTYRAFSESCLQAPSASDCCQDCPPVSNYEMRNRQDLRKDNKGDWNVRNHHGVV